MENPLAILQRINDLAAALQVPTTALKTYVPQSAQSELDVIQSSILAILSSTKSLTNEYFTLFPKLPIEIRLKIWKATLPGPRVVELHATDGNKVLVNQPPPMALSICQESRQEAQKTYWTQGDPLLDFFYPRFDPLRDTVFIPFSRVSFRYGRKILAGPCFSVEQRNSIQCIAFDGETWGEDRIFLMEKLTTFKGLKILILVVHRFVLVEDDHEVWRTEGSDVELVDAVDEGQEHSTAEVNQCMGSLRNEFNIEKQKYPDWKAPVLEFKVVQRSGKRCCDFHEE